MTYQNLSLGKCWKLLSATINRIYKNFLDRDWFSTHPFVTQLAHDHVGVQLRLLVI